MRGNSDKNNTILTYQKLDTPDYTVSDKLKLCNFYRYRYSLALCLELKSDKSGGYTSRTINYTS